MEAQQERHIVTHDEVGIEFGSRLLYLHTPYFQGSDVAALQTALEALGFSCGGSSGIFDAYTEGALRRFQINMGLDADGIAGVETYATIKRLEGAWKEKNAVENRSYMSFARASEVLEAYPVCIFGTHEYTRMVASNISNLALATNPYSRMLSAEHMPVVPTAATLMLHVIEPSDVVALPKEMPIVCNNSDEQLGVRIGKALQSLYTAPIDAMPRRLAVEVAPLGDADDPQRRAHHDAIEILDAICIAYSQTFS
ncbi:MAG: peptidoglycan-binding protein [Eggerthellaceae bacterium]|nr:peptidoglycan-binding protein [Eggerthellaceae bacterium]